ncbi:MFS transporter [Vogesella sp. LIG4]|uniref:MFS transporter n=1 Tax=Vogesella sp. LIG4 TaxID=1192162 RepID=UPI00081FFEF4|nr:MFS transporter [Vogesella sp. LIG4]SCK23484.1 Predicted arabinose efflux permease, MFS family [Vogesella sp. LIG4]
MKISPLASLLLAASAIVSLSMGVRHGFGFFLPPMTQAFGWTRETFALALGLQNLVWGASQPFAGAFADRYGPGRVLVAGGVLYSLGLALMTVSANGWLLSGSAGLLIGLALSCTTYSVVYTVIVRAVPDSYRSSAMGLTAAAGSFGQFIMVPVERGLIDGMGWLPSLLVLAAVAALLVPLAAPMQRAYERAPLVVASTRGVWHGIVQSFSDAWRQRSFRLLMAGYFVCGFQVVFIGVHLPAYLRDHGLSGNIASTALALIGLFNVFGTYCFGKLGGRYSKPYLLATIYLVRSVVIALFLMLPLSGTSVAVFAAAMGFLWLSTVPLTNGVIVGMFGIRNLGMLSGAVFFSHQVGSFLGVWLGGLIYDRTGSYNLVWGMAIALGVAAALANLPVKEAPVGAGVQA